MTRLTQLVSSKLYMHQERKETIRQFVRFALVGVSNTAVDFGIYTGLTRLVPFFFAHIYFANTLSFIGAATWSYWANRTWTFKKQSRANAGEALRFYLTTGVGFIINTTVLFVLVHEFGVYDLVAKAGAVIVTIMWNFMISKLWVFKQ